MLIRLIHGLITLLISEEKQIFAMRMKMNLHAVLLQVHSSRLTELGILFFIFLESHRNKLSGGLGENEIT